MVQSPIMVKQAGKSHNYPSKRNSYATSRKGVGGRPRKNAQTSAAKTSSTILSHFQQQHSQLGKSNYFSNVVSENPNAPIFHKKIT